MCIIHKNAILYHKVLNVLNVKIRIFATSLIFFAYVIIIKISLKIYSFTDIYVSKLKKDDLR